MLPLDPTQIVVAAIAAYAAIQSKKAAKNSKPVSNGFTYYVKEQLKEIRHDLRDMRAESKKDWTDHYDKHH